eukprot:6806878-Pyramimonas_sp.AAC.1
MQEYTISVELLMFMMVSRQQWMRGERKKKAMTLLVSFVADVLGASLGEVALDPPPRRARCRSDRHRADWCAHTRGILKFGHARLPDLLVALGAASTKCGVCKEWYASLVRSVAMHIARNLRSMELPALPLGLPILKTQKRARRIDDALSTTDAV